MLKLTLLPFNRPHMNKLYGEKLRPKSGAAQAIQVRGLLQHMTVDSVLILILHAYSLS